MPITYLFSLESDIGYRASASKQTRRSTQILGRDLNQTGLGIAFGIIKIK